MHLCMCDTERVKDQVNKYTFPTEILFGKNGSGSQPIDRSPFNCKATESFRLFKRF